MDPADQLLWCAFCDELIPVERFRQHTVQSHGPAVQTSDTIARGGVYLKQHQARQELAALQPGEPANAAGGFVAKAESAKGGETGFAPTLIQGMTVRQLPFVLLPPGRWDISTVVAHYRALAREGSSWNGGRRIDTGRLYQIVRLNPVSCWVGKDMWKGYVVFEFASEGRVIVDCPFVGNAIYVFGKDWKDLIRLSKDRVRSCDQYAIKIVHKGDWFGRLQKALGRGAILSAHSPPVVIYPL